MVRGENKLGKLKPLHDPTKEGVLKIVGLMSGTGSNLRKIIEWAELLKRERGQAVYQVVAIFSDSSDSMASQIGKEFDLPVIIRDVRGFYAHRAKPRSDLKLREEFDQETVKALSPFKAKVAAYAGYMSIATWPLIEAYLGVNVHPADLSIENIDGRRKFIGSQAVRDAILAGEPYLRSTTHLVEPVVDAGRILMISPPLPVILQEPFDPKNQNQVRTIANNHQERLKKAADWIIFPKTLQYIAEGRYAQDEKGHLFFDGKPIPQGLRLEIEEQG